jgi:hypothetical protein
MAKRDDLFPSKYLKAADLKGKPHVVEIEEAPIETFKNGSDEDRKVVLHFVGRTKPLPLNMTNFDSVADIAGDDTKDWPGHHIEVFPTTTEMKGRVVDCIRVRKPQQGRLIPPRAGAGPKPSPNQDPDDVIPF